MSIHLYQVFGLAIASHLPLHPATRVMPEETHPQVHIHAGCVPIWDVPPVFTGVLYQVGPQDFQLEVPGVATYFVTRGEKIVVELSADATPQEAAYFVQGSPLAALLVQRGGLVLHASAIRTPQGAVLFAGSSSTGKSVLAAAFHAHGYSLLTDELCLLMPGLDGRLLIYPAFPEVRLWPDALKKLGLEDRAGPPLHKGLSKRSVTLVEGFAQDPLPIQRIFVLGAHNQKETIIEPLSGKAAFEALMSMTYLPELVQTQALRSKHFALLAATLQQATIQQIHRYSGSFHIENLASQLETCL